MNRNSTDQHIEKDAHLPRKIFHLIFTTAIPLALYFDLFSLKIFTILLGFLTFFYVGLDLLRISNRSINYYYVTWFKFLLKTQEMERLTGASYYLIGALFLTIFFSKPVVIVSLLYISLGDPVAALIGKRYPLFKLLNNKSAGGSLSFFGVCLVISLVFGSNLGILPCLAGSFVATISELVSSKVDDNLSTPVAAAVVITLLG
ncbi:MAG: diacylglycerol/polyprenol kinase family protein [Nitrospinota bacterium]